MISAFPSASWVLAVYAAIACGMVGFNLWVLLQFFPRKGGTPTLARAALIGFILISSMGLWVSILYDELTGDSSTGFTAALFGIQIMMMAPFVWAFVAILRGHERYVDPEGWAWPSTLTLLMLGNELWMGAVFSIALGARFPSPSFAMDLFTASAGSVWFFWAMFANMALLLFWVPFPRAERIALVGLAASALVGPWVVSSIVEGLVLMTVVMTGTFLLLLREVVSRGGTHQEITVRTLRTAIAVAVGFGAMFSTQLLLVSDPNGATSALPYLFTMFGVMIAEMLVLTRRILGRPTEHPPQKEPTAEPDWESSGADPAGAPTPRAQAPEV